jgi:hypothetical protein
MKDLKHIEELLEKYYQGETSTAEEKSLRVFFEAGDVPEHLKAEAGLFGFFSLERETALPGKMEARLEQMITGSKPPKHGLRRSLRYYWMSAAAAVILILVGIFVDMRIKNNTDFAVMQDTYEDPYLAYTEAKKVLFMVSEKMNAGRKPLKNLDKLESGTNYMHPFISFGAGIQHLEHLNTLEKTKELISK